MNAEEFTDESLMADLAEGKQTALSVLMRRYQKDIYRFCLHYLRDVERAQDLTQETFIRVFTASGRFDQSRRFRPWVLCIARNLCLNELKRKKTVPMESLEQYASSARADSGELFRSSDDTPDERAMAQERQALLAKALDTLSEDAREIVILRYFQQMSAKEIADVVESTEGAIRTKLHRIMSSLRDTYQECRQDL